MSAVTKLFVVLQVVLVLILSAGVVTWVNTAENWKAKYDEIVKTNQKLTLEKASAQQALAVEVANNYRNDSLMAAMKEADTASRNMQADQIQKLNQQIAADVNQMASDKALAAQLAESEQLEASELRDTLAQNTALNNEIHAFADKADESDVKLAQEVKQNSIYADQVKWDAEKNSALKKQVDMYKAAMLDHGTTPLGSLSGPTAPPKNIAGVVRRIEMTNGVTYATISVGLNDGVQIGTRFEVVDDNGNFMGVLTVQTANPTEAFGKLEGDHVSAIRQDMKVTTQL